MHFDLRDEKERSRAFDQYRILADARNKILDVRINSNNFWTTVSGASFSALAYLRDMSSFSLQKKGIVLWSLIFFGLTVCLSWILYLSDVAKQLETKNEILIGLEKNFPVPLFTIMASSARTPFYWPKLKLREIAVPLLFIAGYAFFAILLLFFPLETVIESQK